MSTMRQASSGAAALFGDLAPKLRELTEETLFDDIWNRPDLSPRDRSLITCAALIATGQSAQLASHGPRAIANGVTAVELEELVTHLAFYCGWPRSLSGFAALKPVIEAAR